MQIRKEFNKNLILLSIILSLIFLMSCSTKTENHQIITFNIRYDNPNDSLNNWHNRKDEIVKLINKYNPSILGIQEGLLHQINYLANNLSSYNYIGVGRDDGKEKGEFSAIFYDSTKFSVERNSTFWLSPTPSEISIGWDAALERICTYGLFRSKITNKPIWVFNTHFDHVGKLAKENSAKLILNEIEKININKDPLIIMGDLNSEPDHNPIRYLTKKLSDGKSITKKPFEGPLGTFTGFKDIISKYRIDYIFVYNINVLEYIHIDEKISNTQQYSDHLPVFAKIEL